MVDGEPLLMLPLVHHLVQQGLERGSEPIARDMPRGDRDLRPAPSTDGA
jgi:hypothetical protein